jgi:hypothetical protein
MASDQIAILLSSGLFGYGFGLLAGACFVAAYRKPSAGYRAFMYFPVEPADHVGAKS